jgi:hypothetical protein
LPNLKRLLCLEQMLRSGEPVEYWTIDSIAAAIDSVVLRMDVSDRDLIQHARISNWSSEAASLLTAIDNEDSKAIKAAQQTLAVSIREGIEACGRQPSRAYATPSPKDLIRESFVHELLAKRFDGWQVAGCIPSTPIERGNDIGRPIVGRGWTWWHHLHNPRQLLLNGLFAAEAQKRNDDLLVKVALLLSQMKLANWCSKISIWNTVAAKC